MANEEGRGIKNELKLKRKKIIISKTSNNKTSKKNDETAKPKSFSWLLFCLTEINRF